MKLRICVRRLFACRKDAVTDAAAAAASAREAIAREFPPFNALVSSATVATAAAFWCRDGVVAFRLGGSACVASFVSLLISPIMSAVVDAVCAWFLILVTKKLSNILDKSLDKVLCMGRNWLVRKVRRWFSTEELVLPPLPALPVAPALDPVTPDELPVLCPRLMVERRRPKCREWPEPLWPRGKRLAMTMMDTDRMQIKRDVRDANRQRKRKLGKVAKWKTKWKLIKPFLYKRKLISNWYPMTMCHLKRSEIWVQQLAVEETLKVKTLID